jgi:hypothetical protein
MMDGGITEIRRGKKGSVVAPKEGRRIGGRGKSDMNRIMITAGKMMKEGGRGKGSMAHIHKNVIQTRVHRDMVTVDLMESVVGGISTCKGSIRKRSKHRKQVGPGLEKLDGGSGTAITDRVRIGIPVTNQKIIGGIKIGRFRKAVKEMSTIRTIGMCIDVGNFVNLPLEAKS